MTFLEYIRDVAPKYCGVDPKFGHIAELVYKAEIDGDLAFRAEAFPTARRRAEMAAPYPADYSTRNHVLNVIELAICYHRQSAHAEDHSARIAALKQTIMNADEIEMTTSDWWNG